MTVFASQKRSRRIDVGSYSALLIRPVVKVLVGMSYALQKRCHVKSVGSVVHARMPIPASGQRFANLVATRRTK